MGRLMYFAAVRWDQGLVGYFLPAVFSGGLNTVDWAVSWTAGCTHQGLEEQGGGGGGGGASQDLDLGFWLCNRHLVHAKTPIFRVQVW